MLALLPGNLCHIRLACMFSESSRLLNTLVCWCLPVQVIPVNSSGAPIGEIPFTRTGLLGFVGPVRLFALACESVVCLMVITVR